MDNAQNESGAVDQSVQQTFTESLYFSVKISLEKRHNHVRIVVFFSTG
jgi:hypothetical protein